MIVTSKRCYLNILTQICDKDTLLKANYYMCDSRSPTGGLSLSNSMRYNEDGQLVMDDVIGHTPPAFSQYNITYGAGELDPTPYVSNVLMGLGDTYHNPVDRFIDHLNHTETKIAVYNMLFKKKLAGNGLQILIFSEDDFVKDFAYIVCGYLASNFGADITFIDPQYRPDVKGNVVYNGDKVYAENNIKDLRDMQLLLEFNQAVTQCGGPESIGNLTTYLNAFDVRQLIYLYNLLFPDAPLPPDNYTSDHIKQIIIGRVTATMPKHNLFSNIVYSSDEYMRLLEEYDDEH